MTMANLARRNILQYSTLQTLQHNTLQTLHHAEYSLIRGNNDNGKPGTEKYTAI